MAELAHNFTIKTEADAFRILKQALEEGFGDDAVGLKFKGWPVIEIELEGPGYKSTITPDMAAALVAIQTALNRTYALIVKNHASARHLTDEEKLLLQFKAKVEDGCSLVKIDLGDYVGALVNATVGKMTGKQVAVTALGVAIAYGSVVSYKAYLQNQTQMKTIEQQTQQAIALSKQETERLKIFADAVKQDRKLKIVQGEADGARTEVLKGVSDAETLTLAGVEITNKDAQVAVSKSRERSNEVQLNGTYFVSEASFKTENATRIHVRARNDGREFSATFQDDSLDQEQLQILKDAAFAKTAVYLSINGTELRGEVTSARIISVSPQPDDVK